MNRTPRYSRKKSIPSQSIKKLLERNKDKTSAMKKMLKLIDGEETNGDKATEPKTDDKQRSTNR
jgi:hypothetical protein